MRDPIEALEHDYAVLEAEYESLHKKAKAVTNAYLVAGRTDGDLRYTIDCIKDLCDEVEI